MKAKVTTPAVNKAYIAHFVTSGKLDVIELWLDKNARSTWAIRTEGASEDLSVKKYALTFRDKSDYDAFRNRFTPAS